MALNIGTDDYRDYDPEWCDGKPCIKDCNCCPWAADMREFEEPSDDDLEVGFDPYLGCYTDDC